MFTAWIHRDGVRPQSITKVRQGYPHCRVRHIGHGIQHKNRSLFRTSCRGVNWILGVKLLGVEGLDRVENFHSLGGNCILRMLSLGRNRPGSFWSKARGQCMPTFGEV